jgi:hypothetical protein
MNYNEFIPYDKYLQYKRKTSNETYEKRFKITKIILLIFSYFGNIASIFFAFFFFNSLFTGSNEFVHNTLTTLGIIVFLTLIELLKRYIFDIFSKSLIKYKKDLFNINMFGFLTGTLLLMSSSFFFSMNGAQKATDMLEVIQVKSEYDIKIKIDSLNTHYFVEYIKPLKSQNDSLIKQNKDLYNKPSWITSYQKIIVQNQETIKNNNASIINYEKERDTKILEITEYENNKFKNSKDKNDWNIIYFLLISFSIECVILIGVYYRRHYNHAVVIEYEKHMIKSSLFKKWLKFDKIMELIYSSDNSKIGEKLESTTELLELIKIKDMDIDKKDLDDCFKVLAYLKIYKREGPKRILNVDYSEAKELLKQHFKIK